MGEDEQPPTKKRDPLHVFLTLTVDEARAVRMALELTYLESSADLAGLSAIRKLRVAMARTDEYHAGKPKRPY